MAQLQSSNITGSFYIGTTSVPTHTGYMWYNTTTNNVEFSYQGAETEIDAFQNGPARNTIARSAGAVGLQNAALFMGGRGFPSPSYCTTTEEYNGSTFTSVGSLSNARYLISGIGTQNSALAIGGYSTASPSGGKVWTESYNGTSWGTETNLPAARAATSNFGEGQNSAGITGGQTTSVNAFNTHYQYNGNAWSTCTAVPQGARSAGSGGTTEDAFVKGGNSASPNATYYDYHVNWNGTSWSSNTTLPYRQYGGNTSGTSNDHFTFAMGSPSCGIFNSLTNRWDGTSFSTGTNFPQCYIIPSRSSVGGTNTSNSSFMTGVHAASPIGLGNTCSVAYNRCAANYTFCSWEHVANLRNSRWGSSHRIGGADSALSVNGANPSSVHSTEAFNGTSWSDEGNTNENRNRGGSGGTQNSAIFFAGLVPPISYRCATEEYNGTSWSNGGNMPFSIYVNAGDGTQNDAITAMGYVTPTERTCVATYNGTSWTTGPNTPAGRSWAVGIGSTNAFSTTGGNPSSTTHQIYNGSSWSSGTSLLTARFAHGLSGTNNDDFNIFTGNNSPHLVNSTHVWDGTSWSTSVDVGGEKQLYGGSAGSTSNSGLIVGGTNSGTTQTSVKRLGSTSFSSCRDILSAWTTQNSLSTARSATMGFGTSNTAVVTGGVSPSITSATEEFDSYAWSTGGNLSNARYSAGDSGTQNAGIIFGGRSPSIVTCTEEYNGTSWSDGGSTPVARINLLGMSGGTQNATMGSGGRNPTSANHDDSFEYNGTSWSTQTLLPSNVHATNYAGNVDAAVYTAGLGPSPSPRINTTVEWNGATFSAANNGLNTADFAQNTGTQNDAFSVGGRTNSSGNSGTNNQIQKYDGWSWSTGPNKSFTNYDQARAGSGTSQLLAGGYCAPSRRTCVEQYNENFVTVPEVLYSFQAGGNISTARFDISGAGDSSTSVIAAGGFTPSATSATEHYNGSSWSSGGNMNIASGRRGGTGSENSAIMFGGQTPTIFSCTEEYNGTTWSEVTNVPTAAPYYSTAGTQNSSLVWGYPSNTTFEYNGSSFTTGGNQLDCKQAAFGVGTQNAALSANGVNGTSPIVLYCTENYDGSSWSVGQRSNQNRIWHAMTGTQNDTLKFFGAAGHGNCWSQSEIWDGTTWSTGVSVITARRHAYSNSNAPSTSAIVFGGYINGSIPNTEEYSNSITTGIQICTLS